MKSSMFWIGALTVLVAGASPVAAQEEPGPQVFGEVIDVRVVNVEAVVTDEKGNVARGLKPEDFRRRGKRQHGRTRTDKDRHGLHGLGSVRPCRSVFVRVRPCSSVFEIP